MKFDVCHTVSTYFDKQSTFQFISDTPLFSLSMFIHMKAISHLVDPFDQPSGQFEIDHEVNRDGRNH
jgi:hypothetical protein